MPAHRRRALFPHTCDAQIVPGAAERQHAQVELGAGRCRRIGTQRPAATSVTAASVAFPNVPNGVTFNSAVVHLIALEALSELNNEALADNLVSHHERLGRAARGEAHRCEHPQRAHQAGVAYAGREHRQEARRRDGAATSAATGGASASSTIATTTTLFLVRAAPEPRQRRAAPLGERAERPAALLDGVRAAAERRGEQLLHGAGGARQRGGAAARVVARERGHAAGEQRVLHGRGAEEQREEGVPLGSDPARGRLGGGGGQRRQRGEVAAG